MSRKIVLVSIVVVAGLLLTGSRALYWTTVPLQPGHSRSADCASCHDGSVLRSHNDQFIRIDHGHAALDDRQSCMGCHDPESCTTCHSTEQPEWHTEAFCNPDRSASDRDEHLLVATARRRSCMECHAPRFHGHCSDCHTREEWSP